MSDPVTNTEVEDVLSSIRRLVSEDKRPKQAAKAERKNDRLVLTPALRVAEDQGTPEAAKDGRADGFAVDAVKEALAEQPADAQADKPLTSIDDLVTDDALLDVYGDRAKRDAEAREAEHAVEEDTAEELAEDYSDDPYGFDQDAQADDAEEAPMNVQVEGESPLGEATEDDTLEVSTAAPEDDTEAHVAQSEADVISAPSEKAAALSAKIEALETAIGNISDTFEPDDAGESDYAGTEPEAMAWEDEGTDEDEPTRPQFSHSAAVFSSRMRNARRKDDVNAKAATHEAEDAPEMPAASDDRADAEMAQGADVEQHNDIPQAGEIAQDDAPEAESDAEENASWADEDIPTAELIEDQDETPSNVDIEDWQETMNAEPAAAPESGGIGLDDEEQLLDEDALRDLISDIVREELQGALGERITRNVRKLVRREIHRALTAQELE